MNDKKMLFMFVFNSFKPELSTKTFIRGNDILFFISEHEDHSYQLNLNNLSSMQHAHFVCYDRIKYTNLQYTI